MLVDEEKFYFVENTLIKNGTIDRFENDNGKITGRMMITLTEVPKEILNFDLNEEQYYAFECSFDFYDASLGIVLNTKTLECLTGMWITPQTDNAVFPAKEWQEFFIETLVKYIDKDGIFSIPIYVFLNDNSDFAVVPTVDFQDEHKGTVLLCEVFSSNLIRT